VISSVLLVATVPVSGQGLVGRALRDVLILMAMASSLSRWPTLVPPLPEHRRGRRHRHRRLLYSPLVVLFAFLLIGERLARGSWRAW
jgi:hypothetical protein